MKILSLKNCDTCRKALKEIQAAGLNPDIIDVRQDTIDAADITAIVKTVGWEKALNRRSTTWRGLDTAQKTDVDDAKAIKLIMSHPTLLKRPAIMSGLQITVGWDQTAKTVWV